MADDIEVAMRISRAMQALARAVDQDIQDIAGKRVSFSLFIWSLPRCNYVSNTDRENVRKALRELLAAWDTGMPDVPMHEVQ